MSDTRRDLVSLSPSASKRVMKKKKGNTGRVEYLLSLDFSSTLENMNSDNLASTTLSPFVVNTKGEWVSVDTNITISLFFQTKRELIFY